MSSSPVSPIEKLSSLGWSSFFQTELESLPRPLVPLRVATASRGRLRLLGGDRETEGFVAGRLARSSDVTADLPAVGDWVGVEDLPDDGLAAVVHRFARRTCFARKAAGRAFERQVVAANVDRVFLVTAVGPDVSARRLERYLAAAAASGADAALVLGKADLTDDLARCEAEVRAVAGARPVFVLSARTGQGVEALEASLRPGETVALLGSSGVGKSALANRLLGVEKQEVGAVREHDGRGKHTTTHRELVTLPGGAFLVDTPGMRELGLWGDADTAAGAFDDIDALAGGCRFGDCTHRTEPGCRVLEALEAGRLEPERFESFEKLGRELRHVQSKDDGRARREQKQRAKTMARSLRAFGKK